MEHTLTILLALLLAQSLPAVAQEPQPPGPEQSRSVGRMAISERPALPAVIGGDKDGWSGGEVPPLVPPAKPLVDVRMRDPSICRGPDNCYYLIGTTGENMWRENKGIEMWKSPGLTNWEYVGYVWTFEKDAKADWQKGILNADGTRTPKPLWAPELHYIKGQWYIAACVEHLGTLILKSATGRPEGPYADIKPEGHIAPPGPHDASLFQDDDEEVYFLCAAARIARMKADMSDLAEPLRNVNIAPGTKAYNCEGPHMAKLNGRYYLFVSQGTDHSNDGERAGPGAKSTYDVWVMSAPTPYGPFEKRHLAFPRAGHIVVFQDHTGSWWSTWGTNTKSGAVGLPFFEKPAIIPIEMDSEGKLRQSPPPANPSAPPHTATAPIPKSTAFARAGDDPSRDDFSFAPSNAEKIVSRHEGVWTAPPRKVPSNAVSDAPLLGNGDIGVLMGGPPERQRFYVSKCDFWRPQPYFPWFTPALVGALDLEIPEIKGAGYKAVQDIAKAEVRQAFTRPEGTVEMRSWTPATGHELIVEMSCTGKPVEINVSPWTYFGNGATVAQGREGEVSWLTRCFTGPGYDWESQATMAVHVERSMEGSTAGTVSSAQGVVAKVPTVKAPLVVGGRQLLNKETQQYSKPFQGQIHALDLYDRAMTEDEIARFQKGGEIEGKPIFTTRHSELGAGQISVDKIAGVSLGDVAIAPKSFTLILDVTPAAFNGQILQIGEPGKGLVITQHQRRSGYHLQVRAGVRTVGSMENLAPNQRIAAVITSDAQTLLLRRRGNTTGARRSDGTPRTLTLQPGKPVRLVAAVRTNQEQPDFKAAAIQEAKSLGADAVAKLQKEHRQWWRNFWSESSVEISDPVLEGYYYGSFYIMACCSRNKDFAPPLFGNWASGDVPAMGGDFHMNYNHQGPWWGCYIANHIGLTDPYDAPVLQYMERGKYMANKYLGRKGVYYCVGIGPKGSCTCWDNPHDGWKNDSPANHFFAGQKCDALFGGINMAMRWNATLDPAYARKVYPYMRELAAFWEDDLVWENGRYSIVHDNIHEGSPAPNGEKNNPLSLGFLRSCLKATLAMSRELGVDVDKREKWQHILDHLSGFTVFQRNGKKVFRYSEEGRDFATINGAGLQHVYPADAIGLESSPEMLEITRNTIEQHPQCWKCVNTTMSFYPGMARAGYDPKAILNGLHTLIDEFGYRNFVIDRWGGGIETCSTVTATINEMLLQSHQGVIRVFPDWPKDKDARFDKLRAYGAFLVSVEMKSGQIQDVRIFSERGQPCTLRNPWPGKKVKWTRNGKPGKSLVGDLVKFTTGTGDTFDLKPE